MFKSWIVPLISLSLLSIAGYHVVKHAQEKPKLDPPAEPARSPYGESIGASGLVEPMTENISIGTDLPGLVRKVNVEVGQRVKAGEHLFQIDDRQLQADLAVRIAQAENAKAQLQKLEKAPRPEELPGSTARVREAQAKVASETDRWERAKKVNEMQKGVVTEEQLFNLQQAVEMAKQQLAKVEADDQLLRAGTWEPDLIVARRAVELAQAQVEDLRTQMDRLTVNSPVDGEVLQVNVRPGEYVSQQATTPPIILGDVRRVHVRVDIDEDDIPRFETGLPAKAYRRGAAGEAILLSFVRVEPYVIAKKALTGNTTERVDTRVLSVIYAVEATTPTLYIGQQLDVFIEHKKPAPKPVPPNSQMLDKVQPAKDS